MKFLLLLLFPLSLQATTFQDFRSHTQQTAVGAFDRDGLWILGAGSVLTVLARQIDEQTRESWKDHRYMDPEVSKVGEFWGYGIPQLTIFGAQLYFDKENAIPGIEGAALGNLTVQVLKRTIRRERPNGRAHVSMPSGHTQASFSLATSMSQSYGWKRALPFWAMGVFTGLTRLSDDQHWLSDVVAGATIGIVFGRAGFAHHKQLQPLVLFHEGRPDGAQLSYTWNM